MSNPHLPPDGLALQIDSSTTDTDGSQLISVSFPTSTKRQSRVLPESDIVLQFVHPKGSGNEYPRREQREDWVSESIHCAQSG